MESINGIAQAPEIEKLDSLATDGLAGTSNSLAYRVHEIEKHFHSAGSWFGAANSPTATHFADRIGTCTASFQIDGGDSSGAPTWGTWVQIFGSDDTPVRTSQLYYDPHEILIAAAQEEVVHMIQFARGASGAAGLAAGTYTELVIGVDATKKFKGITRVQTGRAPAGSLLWARCIAMGKNTGTVDFYIGIHEYVG
jgi:hypothetical protein